MGQFPQDGENVCFTVFFFKSRRLVWLNQTILTTSVDLWWLIMTFSFWKSWIWLLLSKKNTFYCTLNLTQFSNFTVTLTLSCYQTWWDGLDLTCPSFRGLNFDDFPFFWTFERTSGSRDRPILRFIGNWWHFRNIKDGAVQLPAAKSSSSSYDDDMMMMVTMICILFQSSWSSSASSSIALHCTAPSLIFLKCHQFPINLIIGLSRLPEVRSKVQ